MTKLEEYYNKFSEDKRLKSRHGQVEFAVSMSYIKKCLKRISHDGTRDRESIKILDDGAGTGRYSIALAEEGYDVTALELVRYNLGILRKNAGDVRLRSLQGNALNLKKLNDESFDMVILFGPMYHLYSDGDKVRALKEALRVTKPGGYVLCAYVMNDYAVLVHGFRDGHILDSLAHGKLDENFHCVSSEDDLYDYVRLEDIDRINTLAGCGPDFERVKIISPDGAADYMRRELNAMSSEEFRLFIEYQKRVCERPELLGASSHTVDILKKKEQIVC